MNGAQIDIICLHCLSTHRIALDASGHFSGRLPCQKKHVEIQVDPQSWRQLVETKQAETVQ